MADKIDKDESISRVYQFLSKQQDWKADADKNGDGHIVKTEFRAYILSSNFKFNNGEDKEDLINTFWKSIDTNTSGKIAGSKISNKNALDKAEEKKIQDNIQATEIIMQFAKKIEFPEDVINSKYKSQWKESVKAGILNQAMEFLKNHSIEELTEEKLQEFYAKSSIKAIADYKALDEIEKNITSKYGNIGYKVGSDEVLNGIINEYIQNLKGTEDKNQVVKDIEDIVKAYVSLTVDGQDEGAISILSNYKFFDEDEINPLQEAVLTTRLKSEIVKELQASKAEVYNVYQSTIDPKIDEYVKTVINGEDDYNTMMKNIASLANEFMSQIADIEKEYNDLQTQIQNARSELNTYIGKILAENDSEKTAIVQSVLGITNATEIMNKLLQLKTIEEINAVKTDLEGKIAALEEERNKPVEIADKSQEVYAKLSTTKLNTTDKLIFRVNNNGKVEFLKDDGGEMGIFYATANAFDSFINSDIKNALFKEYKTELEKIFGANSSAAQTNLFNIAVFTAISSYSDQYKTVMGSELATEIIRTFVSMLKNAANDKNTADFIKNYQGASILSGSKTGSFSKYYQQRSTQGNDNWVDIRTYSTGSYSNIYGSGDIIYISSGTTNDDTPTNNAIKALLNDYLSKYKNYISPEKIIELYKQAEETALNKLIAGGPGASLETFRAIYGYGNESHEHDTYNDPLVNVNSVIIQIMYEMEILLNKELLG